MLNQDDDFPYSSDDPSLKPLVNPDSSLSLNSQQLEDLRGTLRLVVGSTLTGTDAFTKRLRTIQVAQQTISPDAIVIDANETSRDQLRYLILGMLFETPDLLQRFLVSVEQVSGNVYGLLSRLLSPLTKSWVFSPVKGQYNAATTRGEQVVERLIMKGRIEEQNSRLILQQKAIDDLVNEFLEYIILKTEVKQLIQEEGVSVAGDVVDDFREQSAAVDSALDQKFRTLFRRSAAPQVSTPPDNPADGGQNP